MSPETALDMHEQPGRLRITLYDQPGSIAALSVLGSRLQQGLILSRDITSRRERVSNNSLPLGQSPEIPSEQIYLDEASSVFGFPSTPEFWATHINSKVSRALDYANIRNQEGMPESVTFLLPFEDFKRAEERIAEREQS